jgi:hypothetical protein
MRTAYSFAAVVGLGVGAAGLATNAQAADWSIGVGIGLPGVVVAAPPPAYVVAPPPAYYVRPGYREVYYPPVRYYHPPGYWERRDEYWRHREWEHHHHHHYDDDD